MSAEVKGGGRGGWTRTARKQQRTQHDNNTNTTDLAQGHVTIAIAVEAVKLAPNLLVVIVLHAAASARGAPEALCGGVAAAAFRGTGTERVGVAAVTVAAAVVAFAGKSHSRCGGGVAATAVAASPGNARRRSVER